MVTCPWCGTSYPAFQSNCKNCGGPLNPPGLEAATAQNQLPVPPPPPRPIDIRYTWRLLMSDGLAITAGVFLLLGFIFLVVGLPLAFAVITAFVGLPFALLGLVFLITGGILLLWRHQNAERIVRVLREGQATVGQVQSIQENTAVRINNRHPWVIQYQFQSNEHTYVHQVTTLSPPGPALQPGKSVRVLYLPERPEHSSIYPHP